MKKIIALLLIVVLSMSITACKPQKEDFVGEWKRGVYAIIDELYYHTLTLSEFQGYFSSSLPLILIFYHYNTSFAICPYFFHTKYFCAGFSKEKLTLSVK